MFEISRDEGRKIATKGFVEAGALTAEAKVIEKSNKVLAGILLSRHTYSGPDILLQQWRGEDYIMGATTSHFVLRTLAEKTGLNLPKVTKKIGKAYAHHLVSKVEDGINMLQVIDVVSAEVKLDEPDIYSLFLGSNSPPSFKFGVIDVVVPILMSYRSKDHGPKTKKL